MTREWHSLEEAVEDEEEEQKGVKDLPEEHMTDARGGRNDGISAITRASGAKWQQG